METVTFSAPGMEPVTMTGQEFAELPQKIGRLAQAAGPPRTTAERLLEDVAQILEESLPPFQASLDATDYGLPASITVKVSFVPAKPDTETKVGDPAQIVVSGKLALPTTKHEHGCSPRPGQMDLFEADAR